MRRFYKSLVNAFRGLKKVYQEEKNFRIHSIVAFIVIIFSIWFKISIMEWAIVIILITLVFALEVVNSIFERVADIVKPTVNQYIKDMKDMMAASVLVASIAAIIIGLLIFIPKIIDAFGF